MRPRLGLAQEPRDPLASNAACLMVSLCWKAHGQDPIPGPRALLAGVGAGK